MIPSPPWLAPFSTGLDALRARSFDAAFSSFDEAVNIGGGSQLAVFASRTEVLARLRVLEGAVVDHSFSDSRRSSSSDDDPSHLFQTLSNLPEYLQTAIISNSTQNSTSLEGPVFQAQALVSSLLQTRSFIDFLPAELLTSIGRYLVLEERNYRRSDPAFKLVAVSRRWRSVFLQDRILWGVLSVDGGTARNVRKVEEFAAKGPLRSVQIHCWSGGDNYLGGLYAALDGRTSSLEAFDASVRNPLDWDVLWSLVSNPGTSSRLRRLSLTLHSTSSMSDLRRLPHLSLPSTNFPSLTSLSLDSIPLRHPSSLLPLFKLVPNLTSFTMFNCYNLFLILPSIDGTNTLNLPSLLSLAIDSSASSVLLQPYVLVAPLLTCLSIVDADDHLSALFLTSLPLINYPNLQSLRLILERFKDSYNATLLLRLRELPPTLRSLSLRWFEALSYDIFEALTVREEEGGSEVLFPKLKSLDLAHSGPVWDEETKAMIRSRKAEGRKEGGRCCVVREYVVGDEDLDPEMGRWLKENVEIFRNDY